MCPWHLCALCRSYHRWYWGDSRKLFLCLSREVTITYLMERSVRDLRLLETRRDSRVWLKLTSTIHFWTWLLSWVGKQIQMIMRGGERIYCRGKRETNSIRKEEVWDVTLLDLLREINFYFFLTLHSHFAHSISESKTVLHSVRTRGWLRAGEIKQAICLPSGGMKRTQMSWMSFSLCKWLLQHFGLRFVQMIQASYSPSHAGMCKCCGITQNIQKTKKK